jgi:hypothetical protein
MAMMEQMMRAEMASALLPGMVGIMIMTILST